jgi:predicted transcriptional regulator with HTH domain
MMKTSALLKLEPKIARSLARSRLRTEILRYLSEIYPRASYISEMSAALGVSRTNIRGALWGGRRFSNPASLISMGLVEIIEDGGHRYYRVTNRGRRIGKMLNNEE